ncbi:MAG: pyruvate, phosphate dikinase [Deltaproteobacteria bacterium]|nr:pyruvate, phosphate dikinase [Deltaproteobacteria bacterium]
MGKKALYVYRFGGGKADGNAKLRDLLGGKGANLAEMASLGIPVPPGFTMTTEVCRHYQHNNGSYPEELAAQVDEGLRGIEKQVGRKFGDPRSPLLLSIRSGAASSMPGMMDTILNLGLNDETVEGLIRETGDQRFSFDNYRRFIQMYGDVVLGVHSEHFEEQIRVIKTKRGITLDTELTAEDLQQLVQAFKAVVGEKGATFPQEPREQLWGAIGAVFGSWNGDRAVEYRRIANIPDDLGTACNVQAMVFGNRGEHSATGVAFTRDPATGANCFFGEYLMNAQGEDVVAGIRTPQPINRASAAALGMSATHQMETLEELLPACYTELDQIRHTLEKHYRDMQDVEFTIESGKLWMLQTRAAKRTAAAAVKAAVDFVEEGLISQEEAIQRVKSEQIEQLLHHTFDPNAKQATPPMAKGLAASPGAAVGKVVFTADDAVAWCERGEPVILVRHETSPEDIHGMNVAQGILTACGGVTSHAAVVARGMGKPCVAGCHGIAIDLAKKTAHAGAVTVREGEWLSIDGATGEVFATRLPLQPPVMTAAFQRIMEWADLFRKLGVRTNAETARDVQVALEFGAEGIGLARTEHMFFEPGRIEIVREMILAESLEARKKALAKLLPMQKGDFRKILALMDGRPVTIRLLDPPLHEFLPHTDDEVAEVASVSGIAPHKIREITKALHEQNPMLGHRGCRLGVTFPEIYAMQAQAMLEAASELQQEEDIESDLEIEIPLVGHVNELRKLRSVVEHVAAEVMKQTGATVKYTVGAMLELPRACLITDQLAKYADFFSFGTNDLTQTTMGVSRDDAGRFLNPYIEEKIVTRDPFATIDESGVGRLMGLAVESGKKAKKTLLFGICGEHGGDPQSIDFCHRLGLDYVSCSPYRVPVARLAAAHAALRHR